MGVALKEKWGRACLGKADEKQSYSRQSVSPCMKPKLDGMGGEGRETGRPVGGERPHTPTKPSRFYCNPNQMGPYLHSSLLPGRHRARTRGQGWRKPGLSCNGRLCQPQGGSCSGATGLRLSSGVQLCSPQSMGRTGRSWRVWPASLLPAASLEAENLGVSFDWALQPNPQSNCHLGSWQPSLPGTLCLGRLLWVSVPLAPCSLLLHPPLLIGSEPQFPCM